MPEFSAATFTMAIVTGLVYIAAGLIAATRRPESQVGRLLCITGLVILARCSASRTGSPLHDRAGLLLDPAGDADPHRPDVPDRQDPVVDGGRAGRRRILDGSSDRAGPMACSSTHRVGVCCSTCPRNLAADPG